MRRPRLPGWSWAALTLLVGAGAAQAEPMFLSRQYTRCTTCHYSPTGGGLLTPYGRSLSRQELSGTGAAPQPTQSGAPGQEEQFLFGLLGDSLHPVHIGVDLRPAYLSLDFSGTHLNQTMLMTADVLAAYRSHGFTLYGEFGREPAVPGSQQGAKITSYEYWASHESDDGYGFRLGRFLPAYGIRLADHTAYTRSNLGFDVSNEVYGLEFSHSSDNRLLQVSIGPGYADSLLHDDGRGSFTATGRYQMDLSPKTALVFSALYRNAARLVPQNEASGVAFGLSPVSRLSSWTEADVEFEQGKTAYTVLNETSYEVSRGLWLKFSPQFRTDYGQPSGGSWRTVFEADLLPRTHFNVDVSFYRDKNRLTSLVSKTFLAQLHLYL